MYFKLKSYWLFTILFTLIVGCSDPHDIDNSSINLVVFVLDMETNLPLDGAQVVLIGKEICDSWGCGNIPIFPYEVKTTQGKYLFKPNRRDEIEFIKVSKLGYASDKTTYEYQEIITIYLTPLEWNN